jgi:hypothetical protein
MMDVDKVAIVHQTASTDFSEMESTPSGAFDQDV